MSTEALFQRIVTHHVTEHAKKEGLMIPEDIDRLQRVQNLAAERDSRQGNPLHRHPPAWQRARRTELERGATADRRGAAGIQRSACVAIFEPSGAPGARSGGEAAISAENDLRPLRVAAAGAVAN